jgi:hypothetical protein
VHTACLVCFISTENGHSKKEKKPIMSCASSRHITKLKQSIFAPFDIYGYNNDKDVFTNTNKKSTVISNEVSYRAYPNFELHLTFFVGGVN